MLIGIKVIRFVIKVHGAMPLPPTVATAGVCLRLCPLKELVAVAGEVTIVPPMIR